MVVTFPKPMSASLRSSQAAVSSVEDSPLNPASWKALMEKAIQQNDTLSIKSLEIIIEGLKEIQQLTARAEAQKMAPSQLSTMSRATFTRLSKSYNSPTLLKEAGLIYLRDLSLPKIALQHFERAVRLGGPERELRPLTEAAAVAVQKQAQLNGQQPGHSGITEAKHVQPVAPNVIRKTGKMLLPARFTQVSTKGIDATEMEVNVGKPLPSSTPECLEEAGIAIKKGQFKWATLLLQKANEKPAGKLEMWQSWTNLGQACYEAGYYPNMETAFLEALKHDPEEMASHFNVALGAHLNGKFDVALASYRKADEIEPNHPKVWCNLGVLYFQLDKYEEAETALRRATEANPDYARAWDNLAAALGSQDKLQEAVKACERALELRPDYPEAYFKLGVIYFSQNQLRQAAQEFERAVRLSEIAAYCEAFMAMIHARLERAEEAEAAVLRAASVDPKCDLLWMAWNDLGLAWYAEGNYQRAANAYGEATMIKPDEAEAWFNLGVSYHQAGDLKTARDAYQHAVDLKESLAGAWHNLGIVCSQNEDHNTAMMAFRQEVHWAPDNVRAWYDLGVTLEKLGRAEDARVAFGRADALGPVRAPGAALSA
jgi:tetratricopeptide (TPR) repeat protein